MNIDLSASYEALRQIYMEDAYSNLAINEAIERNPGCSRGFVRFLVKGVIRNTRRLDYYIARLSKNGLKGMKKRTLILLRMGIFIISDMEDMPDRVAVNEIVKLSKKVARGNDGFINAVLRNYLRNRDTIGEPADIDVKYSVSTPLRKLIFAQYGEEEGIRILRAWNEAIDVTIRNNSLKQTREELIEALRDSCGVICEPDNRSVSAKESSTRPAEPGVICEPDGSTVNGIIIHEGNIIDNDLFRNGAYTIQGLSSLEAIEHFAPGEGSRVLDMCAAPGGKSTAMAEIMGNRGHITACDIHPHRVELIANSSRRLGIDIIHEVVLDATQYKEEYRECYDYVLCDVPCSGLGTVASKPEIKLRDDCDYSELIDIQSRILENGYRYLKAGGRLMYSTCTINKDENEGVLDTFLRKHSDCKLVEYNRILPYNKNGFFYGIIEKSVNI